ncbi:MAG: hypothetical protein ACXAEU_10125 [Candidatus Hodarchaeales archaeon]|jgi:hypothetical protein
MNLNRKLFYVVIFISALLWVSLAIEPISTGALRQSSLLTNQGSDNTLLGDLKEQEIDQAFIDDLLNKMQDEQDLDQLISDNMLAKYITGSNQEIDEQVVSLFQSNLNSLQDWTDKKLDMGIGSPTDVDSLTVVLEESDTSIRTLTIQADGTIAERTITRGTPKIRVVGPSLGELDEVIVPIIHMKTDMDTQEQLTATVVKQANITYEIQYTWTDNQTNIYNYNKVTFIDGYIGKIDKYKCTHLSTYTMTFRLLLPLEVEITYPEAAIVGKSCELEVAIRPLGAGELTIDLRSRYSIKVYEHQILKEAKVWRKILGWGILIAIIGILVIIALIFGTEAVEVIAFLIGAIDVPPPDYEIDYDANYLVIKTDRWVHIQSFSTGTMTSYKRYPDAKASGNADLSTPLGDRPSYFHFDGKSSGKLTYQRWKSGKRRPGSKPVKRGWKTYDSPYVNEIGIPDIYGAIFCDKVTAALGVSGLDFSDERTMVWGEEHVQDPDFLVAKNKLLKDLRDRAAITPDLLNEVNSTTPEYGSSGEDCNNLVCTIPENTNSTSVRFSVSDLRYYLGDHSFTPQVYVRYGKHTTSDYLSSKYLNFRVYDTIPPNSQLSGLPPYMISTFSYSTATDVFAYANYDFDATLTSLPSKYGPDDRDRYYSVQLTSLGDSEDFIDLRVDGLPTGFTVSFDRNPVSYNIGPDDKNVANFTIHAPDYPTIPPLPYTATLVATSQAKITRKESDPSITRSFDYTPPLTYGVDFIPGFIEDFILPGETIPINFSGINLGNVADNFTVQGLLHGPGNTTREWSTVFAVDRYSTTNQSFNGTFEFTYSPDDYFPLSGNSTLKLVITSANDPRIQIINYNTIDFLPYYNVTSILTPANITMFANYKREFTLSVTNTGNIIDNFTVSADGWMEYLDYPARIENLDTGETREVTVLLSVPDPTVVPVQNHTFRMIVRSENDSQVYSLNEAIVDFPTPDLIAPGLEYWYEGSTLVYPYSSLSLGPSWIPLDDNPGNYTIFVNDDPFASGTWANGDQVKAIMKDYTSYGEGLFNVTAVFNDTSGNENVDMVWVQIDPADLNPPVIDLPVMDGVVGSTAELPVNWIYPIRLDWQFTEDYTLNVTLFIDEEAISQSEYVIWQDFNSDTNTWNVTYRINPGSLEEGLHNFTLEIQDMSGYNETSTLLLDIVSSDINKPVFLATPQNNVNQGHGETITFTAKDIYPHHYTIWVDGEIQVSDKWYDKTPVNVMVEELPLILGDNSMELLIYDVAGNFLQQSWTLTLLDVDAPVILSNPNNLVVFEHNSSSVQLPTWIVTDANPSGYSIYLNGTLIYEGVWSPVNNTVSIFIDHLNIGMYEFLAVFNDTSGNEISSSFILAVEDIIAPAIVPLVPIVYEQYHTANWFEFIVDETNPHSYQLYQNDTLVDEDDIFPVYKVVLVDLDYLPVGYYEFSLVMTDESGNVGTGSVGVTVLDYSPPFIDGPPMTVVAEESTGNTLVWTVNEVSLESYSLYRNGSLVDSGTFTSTTGPINITYSIDDLVIGIHEFVITVEDQYGLTRSLITYVQVLDITPPRIPMIGEYLAELGDPNAILFWEISEKHPAYYQVLVDGDVLQEGQWTGEDIELPLVGWAEGTYTVKIIVTDESGNTAQDEVLVTVEESIPSTAPFQPISFASFLIILFSLSTFAVLVRTTTKRKKRS